MDWNAGQNDRLSVRFNASRYTGVNQESPGPSSALEHTGDNQVNTDNVAGVYTKVFGARPGVGRRVSTMCATRTGFCQHHRPGGRDPQRHHLRQEQFQPAVHQLPTATSP